MYSDHLVLDAISANQSVQHPLLLQTTDTAVNAVAYRPAGACALGQSAGLSLPAEVRSVAGQLSRSPTCDTLSALDARSASGKVFWGERSGPSDGLSVSQTTVIRNSASLKARHNKPGSVAMALQHGSQAMSAEFETLLSATRDMGNDPTELQKAMLRAAGVRYETSMSVIANSVSSLNQSLKTLLNAA